MAIGRISGPLLAKNLLRDGVDLAFETDLLYLDVTSGRIGIRKNNPAYELDVNGTINAKKLKVTYTGPGTGTAELGKLVISSGTISTSVGPITIQPSGNDKINLIGDTTVTGNFHTTGNITADGDIVIGNSPDDNVIFDAEVASNIIPNADKTYSLGSTERNWLDAYVDNLITNKISNPGNISINPGAGLLEINGEINAKGRNPIGTAPVVTNVLYVTMDGNDTNDGRAEDPSRACRTISGAVKSPYYRPGTLIRVNSGRYLENNPILMQPNTAIIGTDLRTTSIEPINKTQDLFHVQSGCYLAQMQFSNGRSGLLPGPYATGSNRGAYATAFPPQVNGEKIDIYHSPYIQNCTNQTGPWLIDGTLFVPNQTVQVPVAAGTTTFPANTTTIVVTLSTGTISSGLSIISGPQTPGFFNARTLLLANKEFIKDQVIAYVDETFPTFEYEQAKYARDIGIIIENIAYDATFGGNEKSIETGLSYYNGVINLLEGQQTQKTAAINYTNTLTQFIIRNEVAPIISANTVQIINTALVEGEIASEELKTGIDIITTIINSGTNAAPAMFKSCGPETPYVSAEILLQANRTFLQEEVTAYVDAKYPNFDYKKDSCYRDVGLIIDAVSQDIVVGGNTKTLEAALSYYTGSKGDSSVAALYVEDNIKLLRDIILVGPSNAPNPVVGPNLGVGFSNAKDLLIRNRNFIQTEVSAYVRSLFDNSYRLTQAQQNSWYTDVGIMIDAVAEDTAAGGNANTVAVGLNFYTELAILLPGAQLETTVNALSYMLTLCSNIVKNIQNTNLYQVLIPQVVNLPAATLVEYELVADNINLITDIITMGPDIAADPEPISLSLTTNTNAINAFNILTANKDFLASELTDYIDNLYGNGFEYDSVKCSRDTGLIVDSLAFDLLYQSNSQAIFAGLQYWNQGTTSIPNEISTTTSAINYAKQLAKSVVVNQSITSLQSVSTQTFNLLNPGGVGTTATIDTLFNTVTNIIINGTAGVSNQIISNGNRSSDSEVVNSYTLLQANKAFIEDEVIAYVDSTNNAFTYDQVKYSRDIDLLVDALSQDLLFNGTSQSNFAGLQYWNQSSIHSSLNSSTATSAIEYVKNLAIKVINNDTSGYRYQTAISQYTTSSNASVVEEQIIYDEFNLILDIINSGTANVNDKIVSNSLNVTSNPNTLTAYQLLTLNNSYIKAEAIAYIEAVKTLDFIYDVSGFSDNIGYMIDGVAFDLIYSGNRQAIQSGVNYYGYANISNTSQGDQLQITLAYLYIKTIISYIVTGRRLPSQYQYSVQQVLSTNIGSDTEAAIVNGNIDLILSIIDGGPSTALTPSWISLTASETQAVVNAANLLSANKELIRAETIAYINATLTGFVYDRVKCRRDVGYIIDCVSFDLLHSGNRQSIQAGVYYYGYSNTSSSLTYEISQATAAYNHIKVLAKNIVKGITIVPTTGNTESQVIVVDVATDSEADYIADDIDIINDIINNGPDSVYPKTPINLSASENNNVINAYTLLLANKDFIKSEVIAYIDYYFKPKFVFDKVKCSRDTKLIVDSVALDLLYSGNTQSTFAGLQYWQQGSTQIPGEATTTTNAIAVARDLATSYLDIDADIDTVLDSFNRIIGIIGAGTDGVSDTIQPNGLPKTSTSVVAAYQALLDNKESIQNDTITWINENNVGFVYDQTKCFRDIGYIVECVAFDLLHGGNRQSTQAGVYYYGFDPLSTNVENEIPQVVAAYSYLKYMIKALLQNNQLPRTYQIVYPQIIVPGYMGLSSAIPGEENITVDAINYLKSLSSNIISNTPVSIVRSVVSQIINTFFDKGEYAEIAVNKNYDIISDVILNGPGVAPVAYAGSGFFATTGVSANDVRESPKIISITTQTNNVYTIKLSDSTVGAVSNGTLYFGNTSVFPIQDSEVEQLSVQYTGSSSTWNSRKVDPIGGMGGSLVDGAVVSDRSPIQSFVYDAYTQINQGGRGIHITNNGYAQLVSVFTVFCSIGVQVDNGGIASIVNSNSNFGDICLFASGYGKREFSGTVYNPSFPTYQVNGEYYPFGFWPKNGLVEIYIPDTANRPHISLVMEVEPPTTYYDFDGNIVPYTNQQGYPGFLNAQPSLGVLTTGSIVIAGIDTTGIAVGNSVYIRDQLGNEGYVSSGTVVTNVGYQTVTLNKGLIGGGQDPNFESNPDFFNLYFCGNAYYTVISSEINNSFGKTIGDRLIPLDQLTPEIDSLEFIKNQIEELYLFYSVDSASITFVNNRLDTIIDIVSAADLSAAEAIVPQTSRIKKATPPVGASLAIETIKNNVETIVDNTIAYIDLTFTNYDHEKCKRDIRLILKQLTYDLEFGGNYYSVYSGLSYWVRSGTHHIVNLEEAVSNTALFPDGSTVNFYQRSYMSASGYVFEYVGAGTNYGALPQRGIKDPIQGKEVVQVNNGKVFFTSTDQNGDFRIGPGLVVSQSTGVLSGRTFTKSLFANLTPFILAIEGGS
jgi:hypothetical protein